MKTNCSGIWFHFENQSLLCGIYLMVHDAFVINNSIKKYTMINLNLGKYTIEFNEPLAKCAL